MKEEDKQVALDQIAKRICIAEHGGLRATARMYRELYQNVASRPAAEIISVRDFTVTLEPEHVSHHAKVTESGATPAKALG